MRPRCGRGASDGGIMLYIGVDIGGMSVKAGVVDAEGKILFKDAAVTNAQAPAQDIAADIAALVRSVAER